MIAYKLFRKRKDGTIGSLFINKKRRLPVGVCLASEDIPTKGFAHRPGWHCTHKPVAPHLSMKDRVWFKVKISDFETIIRPQRQGGKWFLAKRIKILKEIAVDI